MSQVVVVFLLDFLPDFESALKLNLQDLKYENVSTVNACDPVFANFTWDNIKEHVLKSKMFSDVGNRKVKPKKLRQIVWPHMFLPNYSQYYGTSIERSENVGNVDIEHEIKEKDLLSNTYNVKFPELAPFLVAIFETFLNVTAQTCAATLLSKNWVVTAASCLELLPNFYNRTQSMDTSSYTVVANALNPLIDGSVHNVTKIKLHPKYYYNNDQTITPTIALMKIEPEIVVKKMKILKAKPRNKVTVRVYGWELIKRSEGQPIMKTASFEASVSDIKECQPSYSTIEKKILFCLTARNRSDLSINQINSGGPVLIMDKGEIKLSAVAQVEANTPLAAHSLSSYSAWIHDITEN